MSEENKAPVTMQIKTIEVEREPFRLEFFAYEKFATSVPPSLAPLKERLARTTDVDKYVDAQGKPYQPSGCHGYLSIDVLEFLWGKELNDLVMAYVRGLRPSYVRVSPGEVTCDAVPWRVTIIYDVKDDGKRFVRNITQSVEVDYASGSDIASVLAGRDEAPGGVYGHTKGLERVEF